MHPPLNPKPQGAGGLKSLSLGRSWGASPAMASRCGVPAWPPEQSVGAWTIVMPSLRASTKAWFIRGIITPARPTHVAHQ